MAEAARNSSEDHADGLRNLSSAVRTVKLRALPDGDFKKGSNPIWNGRVVTVDVPDGGFSPGALLEMESGSVTYLGELQRRSGSSHEILVEHSLDRAKLEYVNDTWG
jgi:hypothetical protein